MVFKKVDAITIFMTITLLCGLLIFYGIFLFKPNIDPKITGQVIITAILVFYIYLYRFKILLPYIFIPFITLAYGLSGGINFIKRGAEVDFTNELYFLLFVFVIMLVYSLLILITVKRPINRILENSHFKKHFKSHD